MIISSKLDHNNKRTGIGIFYVARIAGTDSKFGLKREFFKRHTECKGNSTTWYSYQVPIIEDGIYEVCESNNFKQCKYYIEVVDGESTVVPLKEVLQRFTR